MLEPTDDASALREFLRLCSRSTDLTFGRARLRTGDEDADFRLEGALVQPASAGARAVVLLRLNPAESTTSRFRVLNEQIERLNREIRERRRSEAAVRQERELLRVTLASIGDAVITTDAQGAVTFLNPMAVALTGWIEEHAVGLPVERVFRIVNETTRESVESPVARVLREGIVVGLANHTVLVARHGVERPIEDTGAPIRSPDGSLVGVVLVFRDVTEQRAAARHREELLVREQLARKAAEAANRLKDDFLATVSHELRTPLTAVLGWTRLLRSGDLDKELTEQALETIERNAVAQAMIVNDILDAARMITGKLRLEVDPVDLAAVVAASVDAVRPAATAKCIAVETEVGDDPTWVRGDATRLQQVVWNLLSNAVKFTPRDGRIALSLVAVDDLVRLQVKDSGEGIPPDVLPFVFDRFRQADGSTTRQHGGLGLGLAIVRHLVEAHGGTVRAESDGPGAGAVFTVELPRIDVAGDASIDEGLLSTPGGSEPMPRLDGLRVLLVEDDAGTRELHEAILETCQADFRICESARECLEVLDSWTPEVLVSDIGMPGEDGYVLIARIRAHENPAIRQLPAVAVTGYAGESDRQRVLRAGFNAFVAKPVEPRRLIELLVELTADSRSS